MNDLEIKAVVEFSDKNTENLNLLLETMLKVSEITPNPALTKLVYKMYISYADLMLYLPKTDESNHEFWEKSKEITLTCLNSFLENN